MSVLDITIDMETCALCPTAAVMSIGAVAWDRNGVVSPFFFLDNDFDRSKLQLYNIDLRGMFVEGFSFDMETAQWWSRQSEVAKVAITECTEDLYSVADAVKGLFQWIKDEQESTGASEVYLWSQGSDFDIAILRHICHKYGIEIPVPYSNFRDHRTFFLESARRVLSLQGMDFDEKKAYELVGELSVEDCTHTPLYDCQKSIYSTWQIMNQLNKLVQAKK